jgi:hypothetical protein
MIEITTPAFAFVFTFIVLPSDCSRASRMPNLGPRITVAASAQTTGSYDLGCASNTQSRRCVRSGTAAVRRLSDTIGREAIGIGFNRVQ